VFASQNETIKYIYRRILRKISLLGKQQCLLENPRQLPHARHTEKEVYREQVPVLRYNDRWVPRPYTAFTQHVTTPEQQVKIRVGLTYITDIYHWYIGYFHWKYWIFSIFSIYKFLWSFLFIFNV